MLQPTYEQLSGVHPEWGAIAILPWDSEIFGFAVADFKAGDADAIAGRSSDVQRQLKHWAARHCVQVIGCSVSALESRWKVLLPQLDFAYVDSTLVYTLPRLHRAKFPRSHPVRLAVEEDREAIEGIAAQVFDAGRYHADPRFPRELAHARFRAWVSNAFDSLGAETRVYVNSVPGSATGFLLATVHGDQAQLAIGAGDFSIQGTSTSTLVFFGFLEALRDSGVRRARSKLSSANMPILNLTAYAGARYSAPEYVFHWHSPRAAHLLPEPELRA